MSITHPNEMDSIWKIDHSNARKGVWWWWFWLFFLDNPKNPEKPLQLMVLWSTKKDRGMECNDMSVHLDKPFLQLERGQLGLGAIACWFFDGKEMKENFLLDQGPLLLEPATKRLVSLTKQKGTFQHRGKRMDVWLEKEGVNMHFSMPLVGPGSKPDVRHNRFFKKFEYRILKLSRLPCRASFKMNGKKQLLKGTAYFQNVHVTRPVIPWVWSIVHFRDGSTLSYMAPRLGSSLVKEDLFGLESKANVVVRKHLEFFHRPTQTMHWFRSFRVNAVRGKHGPVWRVTAKNAEGTLEIGLASYARALWKLGKRRKWLPFKTELLYNEYAVVVQRFRFRMRKKELTLRDVGEGVGNAEHSWGFLV
ncbi:hypothetical protein KJ765_01325 [Candidatus Micrarchaeota archaeon]|nr:hypothetical protein [Candidatus Micrarchaeota archaeon]